jgi:hypothetical protein
MRGSPPAGSSSRRETPATPLGIVLGVSTLAHPREVVGDHLVPGSEEVAWLDPGLVSGLRLGFVEMPGPRARIA